MAKKTMKTKKTAPKKLASEQRRHPRIEAEGLRVTEYAGDFVFAVEAADISEGGIFLKKRMIVSDEPSRMVIHFADGPVEVEAQPIHDRVDDETFGAGYCFVRMPDATASAIREAVKAL